MNTVSRHEAAWIVGHRLQTQLLAANKAATPSGVVEHLVAMQAQEHAYARWSVAQRSQDPPDGAAVDRVFDDGGIIRTHVLRPTWHYVTPRDLRWLMALSGPRIAAAAGRRHAELDLDPKTLALATDTLVGAVAAGPQTRRDLAEILDAKGVTTDEHRLPHLLMYAELHAAICSGPMRGKQHTYLAFDARVPLGSEVDGDAAPATLARRYFSTRGPATLRDFIWWSGLKAADARRGLEDAKAGLATRTIDDRVYYFAEAAVAPRPSPTVDLVQCYDETIISYSESRDVLQTGRAQFPVPLNSQGYPHVILLDGLLLGRWRRRQDRQGVRVETRIDAPLDRTDRRALDSAIECYRMFVTNQAAG